jgi:hypothetical protein
MMKRSLHQKNHQDTHWIKEYAYLCGEIKYSDNYEKNLIIFSCSDGSHDCPGTINMRVMAKHAT